MARRTHARHPPEPPRPGLQRRRRRGQGNRKVARALRHGRPDPRRHSRCHGELQVGAASGFSTSTWFYISTSSFRENAQLHSRLVRRGRHPLQLAADTAEFLLRAEGAPHLKMGAAAAALDSNFLRFCLTALVFVVSSYRLCSRYGTWLLVSYK